MGQEFAQFIEWNYKNGLDWLLLDYDAHKNMQSYVAQLNKFYLKSPELWEIDYSWDGFSWIQTTITARASYRSEELINRAMKL